MLAATYETDVLAAVVAIKPTSIVLPKIRSGDIYNGGFTLVYDKNNHVDLKEVRTAGLGTVYIGYDDFHQVNHFEDMAGKVTDITHNSFGQLETVTQHLEDHTVLSEYVYYDSGYPSRYRLKQVKRAGQVVVEYTYDILLLRPAV